MRASVEKEAQLDRIESKLDQILDMLNPTRRALQMTAPAQVTCREPVLRTHDA